MHGKGIMVYPNGDVYKGEWVEGRKSGQEVHKWKNGDIFEGQWFEGKLTFLTTRDFL